MPAEISQKDGLTLTILSCPSGRPGCVLVRLTGTALHAEIASEKNSAGDVLQPLKEFFMLAVPFLRASFHVTQPQMGPVADRWDDC